MQKKYYNNLKNIKIIFKNIFLIPNLLSISRILLTLVASYFIFYDLIVFILLLLIAVTDFLDGYLSRKLKMVSDFGKFLDPLADKISIFIFLFTLIFYKNFPIWFLIFFIFRDLLILLGAILLFKQKKKLVMSNFHGKLSSFILFIFVILFVVQDYIPGFIIFIFMIISFFVTLLSTVLYVIKYFNIRNS